MRQCAEDEPETHCFIFDNGQSRADFGRRLKEIWVAASGLVNIT